MENNELNKKRYVAFLDILGFKNYVCNEDVLLEKQKGLSLEFALNLLNDIKIMVDADLQTSSMDKANYGFSMADAFLPFSDSVFIVMSSSANDFIERLSRFLFRCFCYNEQRSKHNDKCVASFCLYDNNKISYKIHQEKWYPLLLRCGIAVGEAELIENSAIVSGRFIKVPMVIGKAVAEAVTLEEKGKGPKVFISDDFFNELSERNKNLVVHDDNTKKRHFLWQSFCYDPNDSFELLCLNEIDRMLKSVVNLYNFVNSEKNCTSSIFYGHGVYDHYSEFLKTTIISLYKSCLYDYPNKIVNEFFNDYISKNSLENIVNLGKYN